jgi:hypothetical protein
MTDDFDLFLQQSLAPPQREEDHSFVLRVQAAIGIEEGFRMRRRTALRRFGLELLALAAVTAGLLWVGRAAPIASWVSESPWLAALVLISAFAMLLAVFGARGPSLHQVQNISVV